MKVRTSEEIYNSALQMHVALSRIKSTNQDNLLSTQIRPWCY